MAFDIPHMIATFVILLVIFLGTNKIGPLQDMPKNKRLMIQVALVFVAILILNILWPYGSGL